MSLPVQEISEASLPPYPVYDMNSKLLNFLLGKMHWRSQTRYLLRLLPHKDALLPVIAF
jgi:hypothetical protein